MNSGSAPAVTVSRIVCADVVEQARRVVKDFHVCYWWRNLDYGPGTEEDVREIVLNYLRKGDHKACQRAPELNACR
jgi:hypothetical protein